MDYTPFDENDIIEHKLNEVPLVDLLKPPRELKVITNSFKSGTNLS